MCAGAAHHESAPAAWRRVPLEGLMDREAVKALIVKYLGCDPSTVALTRSPRSATVWTVVPEGNPHKYKCTAWSEGQDCCLDSDAFIDFLARELAIDWRDIFRRYMDNSRYGGEPGKTSASDWTPEEWAAIKPIYEEFFHLPPEPEDRDR